MRIPAAALLALVIVTRLPGVLVPKAETEPANSKTALPLMFAVAPLPTLPLPEFTFSRNLPPLERFHGTSSALYASSVDWGHLERS